MNRYRFHTSIHALPPDVSFAEPRTIDGRTVRPLQIAPAMLAQPLALSFEQAAERLQQLPRMFLEPDGSFVWVAESNSPSSGAADWQVDGVLYDRDERLMFVDLRGECPHEALVQLLAGLGAGPTPIMFQMVRQAIFLDLEGFRQFTAI